MSQKLSNILKKAYHKGSITKREYDTGIKEIKRQRELASRKTKTIRRVQTVKVPEKEMVLGEIKVIKDSRGPRIIFDTGTEQIPLSFDSDNNVNFPTNLFHDALKRMGQYQGFGFPGMSPVMMPMQSQKGVTPVNLTFSSGQSSSQETPQRESIISERGSSQDDIFNEEETIEEEPQPEEEPKQAIKPEPQKQPQEMPRCCANGLPKNCNPNQKKRNIRSRLRD